MKFIVFVVAAAEPPIVKDAEDEFAVVGAETFCEEVGPTPSQGSQASNLRAEAEPFTPRRCTRGSKKLSEHKSNKASQAENVLMRALGLVPDDLDVDDTVVTELQNIFDSPLRDQHVRVIAALFGKEVPPMDVLEKGSASEVLAL
ncbi:hypothetical protein ZWY2020_018810 [Hordeum vulgare]|nr:hypothetical protein ZWY2020_018810 [Hordeum vulgare]